MKVSRLADKTDEILPKVLEAGAEIVEDKVRSNLQAVIGSGTKYESRDGSTGGFFADNTNAAQQVWNTVNLLLRLDREWKGGYEFWKNEHLHLHCGKTVHAG